MHATGDVTFSGNSKFLVNANAAGQASKFEVGGAATLSGGRVQVLAQSGTYAPSTAYTILTATGGLGSTTFNGVTSNLAFLTPSLSYTANNVTLTLVTAAVVAVTQAVAIQAVERVAAAQQAVAQVTERWRHQMAARPVPALALPRWR